MFVASFMANNQVDPRWSRRNCKRSSERLILKSGQRHCRAPCCLPALRAPYRTLSSCFSGIWLLIGRDDSLNKVQPAPQSKQGMHGVASVPQQRDARTDHKSACCARAVCCTVLPITCKPRYITRFAGILRTDTKLVMLRRPVAQLDKAMCASIGIYRRLPLYLTG